jgi:conjugative relaxase-like TrwC/TraI family protein
MLRITPQLNADAAKRYQAQHLSKGDYYLQESENYGHWQGQGAEMLGLKEGSVISKENYDRLCENKRPDDGSKLTMRNKGNRRVAYDFTFSVPKDVSVLAYTTNDQRIIDAFHESCRYTMREVEYDACVRDRKHGADGDRKSGNLVIAEFRHDTSRPVGAHVPDPHLHSHYVVFNASFDPVEKRFKAVQFGELKRDGPYYQEIQINRFSYSMRELGYNIIPSRNGFYRLEGLPTSVTQNFSKRSVQIEQEIARRGLAKGSKLAKEVTLKTRQHKIKGLSKADLVRKWKAAIAPKDWAAVETVRAAATAPLSKEGITHGKAIENAVEHCFERKSVVRDTQVLQAALKIGRGEVDLDELKKEFTHKEHKGGLLRDEREVTTPETLRAERQYVEWAIMGRNHHPKLGTVLPLPSYFSKDQVNAVRAVLNSKDTVTGVIGDAGAGKTSIMPEIIRGIEAAGASVHACAPSTSAKAVLQDKVTPRADTLQKLLADTKLQEQIKGKVIVVDEAGFISSKQMRDLCQLAEKNNHRVILIGDPKQHTSVEAGDAFRAMMKYGKLEVCHLQEIQRQKDPVYKEAVRELAQGNVLKSFEHFEARGAVMEIKDHQAMLEKAADDYVRSTRDGKLCLAVTPVWSEIHAFSDVVRDKLKEGNQLSRDEKPLETVRSYNWTEVERQNVRNYGPGDAITFHKATNGFARHETVKVIERQKNHLVVERPSGEKAVFNPAAKSLFDVGHTEKIGVAPGEKLLIRANFHESKLINGEIVEIKKHLSDGSMQLKDGRTIPPTFKQFTYGYANTSHAAQGKTVDRGILIMGEKAIQAGELRQGYVSNSRFTHSQAIYTTDLEAAKEAMGTEKERKLALDLMSRRKEIWKETMKRVQVKQEIHLQEQQTFREATKVTRAQKIDWTPIRETQKWHSRVGI